MRLLVTRPEPDAGRTVALLGGRGHEAVVAPLTEIRPTGVEIPEGPFQAVLLTSANAARSMAGRAELSRLARLPAFAVGGATAEAARAAGFAQVQAGAGDAASLASLVRHQLIPAGGDLLHLSGRHLAADLAALLQPGGFTVQRAVVYEAVAVPTLPRSARAALVEGRLEGVLAYSPRSARLLLQLTEDAGLTERLVPLRVYCLSAAVAAPFEAAGFASIIIAAIPDEAALLAVLPDAPVATAKAKRV